jgi:hypothetical protein
MRLGSELFEQYLRSCRAGLSESLRGTILFFEIVREKRVVLDHVRVVWPLSSLEMPVYLIFVNESSEVSGHLFVFQEWGFFGISQVDCPAHFISICELCNLSESVWSQLLRL